MNLLALPCADLLASPQLGHCDNFSRCVPRFVRTLEARGIRAVHAGGFSSGAIDEAKQVYTWGDSRNGQAGHGDTSNINFPSIVKAPTQDSQTDSKETFRARTLFVGPHYMFAMGLDATQEKAGDPANSNVYLDKYSWYLLVFIHRYRYFRIHRLKHSRRKDSRRKDSA